MLNTIIQDIYNILLTEFGKNSKLNARLGGRNRLFDQIPPGAPFPRFVFDQFRARPWDSQTSNGYEITLIIHIWSQQGGRRTLEPILAQTERTLRSLPKDYPKLTLVRTQIIAIEARREYKTRNHKGTIQVRLLAQLKD